MKRVACIITVVAVLGGVGAWFLAQRDYIGRVETLTEEAKNVVAGSVQGFLGLGGEKPGVVATVNGSPITLKQVEALYDMSTPNLAMGVGAFEDVRADYSAQLQRLILQSLIRQELAARDLGVPDEDVHKLEALVSEGYASKPGGDFNPHIEEEGVNPEMWRGQLRARLELERWQAELARTVVVSPEEVNSYLAEHPEERGIPEEVEFLVVTSATQAATAAALKSGRTDVAELRGQGVDVRKKKTPLAEVPDEWKKTLAGLEPGKASSVHSRDGAWQYIVFLGRTPQHELTAMEMYAHAESILVARHLPQAFDQWFERAVAKADIRMAEALLPSNAVRPEPRSRFGAPPVSHGLNPESAPKPAMGEVSGEDL